MMEKEEYENIQSISHDQKKMYAVNYVGVESGHFSWFLEIKKEEGGRVNLIRQGLTET